MGLRSIYAIADCRLTNIWRGVRARGLCVAEDLVGRAFANMKLRCATGSVMQSADDRVVPASR